MMTIAEVKKQLPNVQVTMPNGKTYIGRVSGRLNHFPTVTVDYDGILHSKGPPPWIDFHPTWTKVTYSVNTTTPLIYREE